MNQEEQRAKLVSFTHPKSTGEQACDEMSGAHFRSRLLSV